MKPTPRPSPAGGVDTALCELSGRFSLLLLATPINTLEAWREFEAGGHQHEPRFRYTPLDLDIAGLRRQLELIEVRGAALDDDIALLLRAEAAAMRTRLELIAARNTPAFYDISVQVYGTADADALALARRLLAQLQPPAEAEPPQPRFAGASAFRARAMSEIVHYREATGIPRGGCRISEEVSGVLVARGQVLVAPHFQVALDRFEAIIAHEVGTHVLTFLNGAAQPLRLLECGLLGYDELQEGLAVLGEYLVGELSARRVRTIAARVVAVAALSSGASFVEIYREVRQLSGLSPYACFLVTMRVCRAGGFTKDVVYLRGLVALLDFYRRGEPDEVLFTGKLAFKDLAAVRRLITRGILSPPAARPRHFVDPANADRLRALREGIEVVEMIDPRAS